MRVLANLFLFFVLINTSCTENRNHTVKRILSGAYEIEVVRAQQYEAIDLSPSPEKNRGKSLEPTLQEQDNDDYKRKLCNITPDGYYVVDDYRIDRKSKQCSLVLSGEKGHCGSNMLFYPEEGNSVYGLCDCYGADHRGIYIYHDETFQCYRIFTQAFCKLGQWLSLSQPSALPICKINPCYVSNSKDFNHYVELNGTCAKLGNRADNICNRGEIVIFEKEKILPRCFQTGEELEDFTGTTQVPGESEEDILPGGYTESPQLFKPVNRLPPCGPGTLRSLSGRCQRNWVW